MAMKTRNLTRLTNKTLKIQGTLKGAGEVDTILLCSDQHFDSKDCDRKLLKRHLTEAQDKGAAIVFLGDWFDAMQGRFDRRGSKSALDESLLRSDYINGLIEDTTAFLEPFAKSILGWATGNHETSILKHAEIDLVRLCIDRLADKTDHHIEQLPYSGWLLWSYSMRNNNQDISDAVLKMAYTHGAGGGGPVTKGVIATARRATYLPDADIIVAGHIHEAWQMELRRERLMSDGTLYQDTQWHLQLPTYKDEYSTSGDGWWHETGKGPRPIGGYWLNLKRYKERNTWKISCQPHRAL